MNSRQRKWVTVLPWTDGAFLSMLVRMAGRTDLPPSVDGHCPITLWGRLVVDGVPHPIHGQNWIVGDEFFTSNEVESVNSLVDDGMSLKDAMLKQWAGRARAGIVMQLPATQDRSART